MRWITSKKGFYFPPWAVEDIRIRISESFDRYQPCTCLCLIRGITSFSPVISFWGYKFLREKGIYSALQSCCHHFFYLLGSRWYIFEHNYLCFCVPHISPFQCTKLPSGKVDCVLALKILLSASHLWNLEDVQQQIRFQCLEKSDRWVGLFPSGCCPMSAFSVHRNDSSIPLCLPVYL